MKTAVFDLDGTLVNSLYDLADAANSALASFGYPARTYEEYRYFIGNGVAKLCERAIFSENKEDAAKVLELFKLNYEAHCTDKTTAYSGITDVLHTLSQNGFRLAVATNKSQTFATKIVHEFFPDVHFDIILGGTSDRPKKPSPDIIFEILKNFPDTDTAYMIGDSNVDILTAKNAGILSVGCTWGFRDEAELVNAEADFIARSPADILSFLL